MDLQAYLNDPQGRQQPEWPQVGLCQQALLLSRIGRYRESLQAMDQTVTRWGHPVAPTIGLVFRAWQALERGEFQAVASATRTLRQWAADQSPSVATETRLLAALLGGAAEARQGNSAAARKLLDAEHAHPEDPTRDSLYAALAGEVALSSGDLGAAERAFSRADSAPFRWLGGIPCESDRVNNLPFRDGLARVRLARGDLTGAIQIYRNLLKPDQASSRRAILDPRHILQLARLLERTGEKDEARRQYQRFLDLWKDADPALPELKEARQAVLKLQQSG